MLPRVLYRYQAELQIYFLDPMEEAILEVLLGLQVHHPSGVTGVGFD